MRKEKIVEIEGREIVVKEMTIEEVWLLTPLLEDIFEHKNNLDEKAVIGLIRKNIDVFKQIFKRCITPDINQFGASHLVPIIKAFYEVNKDFFAEIATVLQGKET